MTWFRKKEKEKVTGPICGCEHHASYHDPKTGKCYGQIYIEGSRYLYGAPSFRDCTCRQYVGPEPLPEYYAPEIYDDPNP